jgi:hypothetical protein
VPSFPTPQVILAGVLIRGTEAKTAVPFPPYRGAGRDLSPGRVSHTAPGYAATFRGKPSERGDGLGDVPLVAGPDRDQIKAGSGLIDQRMFRSARAWRQSVRIGLPRNRS